MAVDQPLMTAWAAARSLARGLPMPVADSGGARVDTGAADERRRYVFAEPGEGLRALGAAIDEPHVALKLCRPAGDLLALLPPRWRISARSWVMGRDAPAEGRPAPLPAGYRLAVEQQRGIACARIIDPAGRPVASGHAAEHGGVFIYDRIHVDEAHRRRGLGRALIAALAIRRRDPAAREVLTATAAGRALYLTLGWRDLAPYSTATIPG